MKKSNPSVSPESAYARACKWREVLGEPLDKAVLAVTDTHKLAILHAAVLARAKELDVSCDGLQRLTWQASELGILRLKAVRNGE